MARILVVDDDPNLLQMVKLMLQRVEHEVETANGGEKGIVLAAQWQPDLIVLDLMMPDVSGYDVVRKLRADPLTAKIPIVVLTARSQPMDKQTALQAGANAFLSKPVTAKELTERVDAVLKAGVAFRVHTNLLTEPIPPKETASTKPPAVPSPAAPVTPRPGTAPLSAAPPLPNNASATLITPPPSRSGRVPIGAEDLGRAAPVKLPLLPLVTVISLRGGVGTTTIAVNLALILAGHGRVGLADFSPSSGHVHLHLHLPARKHWGQLVPQGDVPNPRALMDLLASYAVLPVDVLAAPPQPPEKTLSTKAAQNILRELSSNHKRLVADARTLDDATKGALQISRAVVVVMADDPPSIQSTGQLLVTLHTLGVAQERVRVVLNHIHPTPDVPSATIQKALRRPLDAELPYALEHREAIRRGRPVVLADPEGAFSRALGQLARTLPL